ncbi:MAG: phosphonate ABC transporter substrate-binding protein [Fusobacteria bacterium]|nr:MAG: phosphonate ABC transporter substrate-binding protein [Fusobacteriota bacterium]KAF0230186.1 MAG: phosphonate ABC transporter substrate-binding [Fusobacteriota bacterium]
MKNTKILIIIAVLAIALVGCGNTSENNKSNITFKIGAIPDQNLTELNKNMELMAKYLKENTGLNVEFVPTSDYAALVTAFHRGDIQLAWVGGLTGVQARTQSIGSTAIAQRPLDAKFKSVFIYQKDLDINKLEDLKGKTFTFGSESSTSGSLMPRYYLAQAGIDAEKDFNGKPNYAGSHDKTMQLVASGAFQAGVLNILVWEKTVSENKIDLSKVKVFYTTPEYYDYNWTINGTVDKQFGKGTNNNIIKAILKMNGNNSEIEKAILNYYQTEKFIPTNNDNYKNIEEVAKKLGMVN